MKWLCRSALVVGLGLASCQAPGSAVAVGWQMLPTGRPASLRGLAAIDANIAFVGGSNGTLLRTVDGGVTWRDVAPPGSEACDFRDLEALDRNQVVAMVAGQPARVYRTEDGGEHWRIVHQDPRPAAFFDAVAFAGPLGVLFGDAIDGRFCLWVSDDGGRTWRDAPAASLPVPEPDEAAFAASGTCLVVAAADRGIFTLVTGGGASRLVILNPGRGQMTRDLPMPSGDGSKGAFSVAWNGARGVVVGGDYMRPEVGKGTVAITFNGGATWYPGSALGYRSAVLWFEEHGLVAVGSHGASWSSDDGRTWSGFADVGFHSLALGLDGSVWASGSDGRVARLRIAR